MSWFGIGKKKAKKQLNVRKCKLILKYADGSLKSETVVGFDDPPVYHFDAVWLAQKTFHKLQEENTYLNKNLIDYEIRDVQDYYIEIN